MGVNLDEKDVRQSHASRLQMLSKAWQHKHEGAYDHSQKLMNLWISGYYQKGYSRWHLINLLNRGVSTVTSFLVEGNPKVNVEPNAPQLRSFAHNLRTILNFLIEREKFADTVLIPGAVASMFGGVAARTFYEYDRKVSVDGEDIKVGTPRVSIIEGCDYIGDPSAKRRSDFAFEGDVYRLPTEYARDLFSAHDQFGNQIADYITPDCKLSTKYSTERLTGNQDWNKYAMEDFTSFIDIYNFKDRVIETIMPMGRKAKILRTVEWDGPGSPYSYLGYRFPPNCPLPIPPAWDWYDQDVTMNLMAKAAREQAESQKNVVVADPSSKAAAEAVVNAKNMDVIIARNPELVKTIQLGGAAKDNYEWLGFIENEFTKSGTASSDVIGGRGSSAPTLGQEQMVYSNATRIVNNFYNRFHDWTQDILEKWAAAVINNPTTYVEVLKDVKLPGIGSYEYPVYLTKNENASDFYKMVLKVVPYSMQRKSPEMKYQSLLQFLTQWILPTMDVRMQQGANIDIAAVDEILADNGGFDSFPQWYHTSIPKENMEVKQMPVQNKFGQGNDSLGASDNSKMANLNQQQERTTGAPYSPEK